MEHDDTVIYNLSDLHIPTKEEIKAKVKPRSEIIKPVVEYSLDGKVLNTYDNISVAARQLNVNPSLIWQCCTNKSGNSTNLICKKLQRIFLYRGEDILDRFKLIDAQNEKKWKKGLARQVYEYNLKGRLIAVYPYQKLAAKCNKVSSISIGDCCRGKKLYIGNRIFLYYGDDIKKRLPLVKEKLFLESQRRKQCRPVDEYNLEGEFIKGYVSGSEASRLTGIHTSAILRCCHGEYLSTHGKIFLFPGDSISERLDFIKSQQNK
jgi:hypothetical protein